MLNDILTGYGIFVLEILTVLLVILVIVSLIISHRQHNKVKVGELEIKDLLEEFDSQIRVLRDFNFSEEELKQQAKAEKKAEKQKVKKRKEKLKKGETVDDAKKGCVYILDFHGDISASETTALREEISAILSVAKPEDEVLLRLESPGGIVHDYGFAASQLARLKQKQFVLQNRPHLDIDKIATGEHWFGTQALELKLVDEITTSDDLILDKMKEKRVLAVKYRLKKSLIKKLGRQAEESLANIIYGYMMKKVNNFIQ